MPSLLGRFVRLPVLRFGPPGAFLAVEDDTGPQTLLLPRLEVPEGTQEGDELTVFVYRDSEDRPIATTIPPMVSLGEVAFLEVRDVTPIGAFFAWGPIKDLLVPFGEQTREVHVGERHPVGLFLDDSGRLAGTMRVAEMLDGVITAGVGEWVEGEAYRNEPEIGLFVIVDRRATAVLPAAEPHRLSRGERAKFRVARVLPDGKRELSLRGLAHEELSRDGDAILETLALPGVPPITEAASPEQIRRVFGISKKAFKRAVGRLLKEGRIETDPRGALRARAPKR